NISNMRHFYPSLWLLCLFLVAMCLGAACMKRPSQTQVADSTPKGIPVRLGNSEPNEVSKQVRKAVLACWSRFDLMDEFGSNPYPSITQTQLLDFPQRSFIAVSIGETSEVYFPIKYLNDEYFVIDSTHNQMHTCAFNGCTTCILAPFESKNEGINFGCACEEESGPCNHSIHRVLDESSSFE
ncbi:MAG: hypothetical protein AAF804_13365, partial [Bacteroidota bacterium]